ncbi:MarR family transcriptional regulator [Mycobacterium sp. ENV421]|uniref:MarR family winged helix-turn-helix transcriptional regulator n=1 Tax=Mycobacterium sp. ENV421 TaxID=1213407 RepID=UPI000C9B3067|nr:MarR family transcriptional regulator [Mycobacterium sp. ENV421]PND59245.1 MarR family transcriptional regulator [Mycobacterium sp. ENV421]
MDGELADLAEAIIGVARELRLHLDTAAASDADIVELTASEAHLMRHIDHHPGVTPSDLARATGLQRSNMSTALRSLENRGFVERRADPHDARGVNLYPTDRAAENLERLRRQWSQLMDNGLRGDRQDAAAAKALLERVEAALKVDRLG